MFKYTDLPAFAASRYQDNRIAAVEALIRNGPNIKYVPNNAYADAKLIIAWWTAALARRLPSGMAVYAVSPGGATATKVVRSAGLALRYLFIPIVNLIPGMNQTPETAASRYIQASKLGPDLSGQFFASAKGKFSGPMEVQRQPHLHDHASQEAAWQAVVKVSGVDLSPGKTASLSGPSIRNGPKAYRFRTDPAYRTVQFTICIPTREENRHATVSRKKGGDYRRHERHGARDGEDAHRW
jgi:hypothetical protein